MATLYNTKTRLPETLPPDKVAQALAAGTHSYKTDDRVNIVGPDGQVRNVAGNEVLDAFGQGYNLESPRQAAVREFVDENKGIGGAAKVALGQFADEALFSVPETIYDLTADPLDVAKKEALKKEHALSNILGGAAGFGASMFYGGPIFKGAALAGRGAERAILGVGEKAILEGAAERALTAEGKSALIKAGAAGTEEAGFEGAKKLMENQADRFTQAALKERLIAAGYPATQADYAAAGLIRKTLASAANMGVQAGVIAAPKTLAEGIFGDPEEAAEHLMYNIGAGAALGGLGSLGRSFARTAGEVATKYADRAMNSLADRQDALKAIAFQEAALGRSLTAEERAAVAADVGVTNVPASVEMLGKTSPLGAGALGAIPEMMLGGTGLTGAALGLAGRGVAKTVMEEPGKIVDGLLFVEKAFKKSAEKLDGVSRYLTEKVSPNAINTTQMNAISRFIGEDVSHKSQQEQLDILNKRLQEIESNPELKTQRIANITSVLDQGGAPQIAQAMNLRMSNLYSYLAATLPKTKLDTNKFMSDKAIIARQTIPENDIRQFQRVLSVILDPYIVFEKLGAGTLTTAEVNAMKQFYPGIFEKGVQKIMADPKQVSYAMRLKLQQLTGQDMETGVQNTAAYQANFVGDGGAGKGSGRGNQYVAPFTAGKLPRFAPSKLNLYGGAPKQPNIAMTATQNLLRNK